MHENSIILFNLVLFGSLTLIYYVFWLPFWDRLGEEPQFENFKEYKPTNYQTKRGEIVKSYGEQQIANYLNWRGIEYEYEHEYIRRDGGVNKPDFYLPEYNVYIEYYGMCHLDKQYDYHMHLKFETFEEEGVKVINLYKKHITNHTLKAGLEIQFKELTGKSLPYKRNHKTLKPTFQNHTIGI